MARAIKERDHHCQFPDCTQTHHLHIHHITHWADGGPTCVSNGASLCSRHHTLVHEGGYIIQKIVENVDNRIDNNIGNNKDRLQQQFEQQQQADDLSLFNVEKELRNNKESFITVRKLSPTRY